MGCKACTEPQCLYSTAIPLLPSVPVKYSYTSTPLSACTVQLHLYSLYGPYGLYRASVPVQYSYTSTPPMGTMACTEPQCLYKGARYLTFTITYTACKDSVTLFSRLSFTLYKNLPTFFIIFNIYWLQLGCHPVAVVILHVNKTWNWLLINLSLEGYMRSM